MLNIISLVVQISVHEEDMNKHISFLYSILTINVLKLFVQNAYYFFLTLIKMKSYKRNKKK